MVSAGKGWKAQETFPTVSKTLLRTPMGSGILGKIGSRFAGRTYLSAISCFRTSEDVRQTGPTICKIKLICCKMSEVIFVQPDDLRASTGYKFSRPFLAG